MDFKGIADFKEVHTDGLTDFLLFFLSTVLLTTAYMIDSPVSTPKDPAKAKAGSSSFDIVVEAIIVILVVLVLAHVFNFVVVLLLQLMKSYHLQLMKR